jgi:hypothetical protein
MLSPLVLTIFLAAVALCVVFFILARNAKLKSTAKQAAVSAMELDAVKRALGRPIPTEREILSEVEVSPGVILHPPRRFGRHTVLGQIEEVEHPGTVVARIVKIADGIGLLDSESDRVGETFPSIEYLIFFEEQC